MSWILPVEYKYCYFIISPICCNANTDTEVVEVLRLEVDRTVVVIYADECKDEIPVAGAVIIIMTGKRFMNINCIGVSG